MQQGLQRMLDGPEKRPNGRKGGLNRGAAQSRKALFRAASESGHCLASVFGLNLRAALLFGT
jgi:hypothetical protein